MVQWSLYADRFQSFLDAAPDFLPLAFKALVALAGGALLWLLIKHLIHSVEKKAHRSAFVQEVPQIFGILRRALRLALVLVVGTYLIRLFQSEMIEKIFQALLLVIIATPIKDFLIIALDYLKRRLTDKTETHVDDIIFDLLRKFSGVIIYAIATILALDILGINVMPFVAGAGVAGIAIGFAAKDTLSNLIAGVLLIIDRPFEIGDRIEVWSAPAGTATWGDVVDIGLRATRIKTTDNIIIVIPNNEIMKRDIVNYTLLSNAIRVRIDIGVAYDTDIAKAKKAIMEVAASADWIARQPAPKVVVRNFGESSVDLQLRVWINDARKRMDTISFVTDRVKAAFDRDGIEIPYPRRDITIVQKN